jgi:DNA modification methylase
MHMVVLDFTFLEWYINTQIAIIPLKYFFLEQCLLTNSTFPFLVTRTSKIVKSNNHFSVPEDIAIKERDSGMMYKRQKPVKLYEELLEVLKADKSQHVIDACSGVATCAVACLSKDIKCVVLEKSAIKARLISQRLKQ